MIIPKIHSTANASKELSLDFFVSVDGILGIIILRPF